MSSTEKNSYVIKSTLGNLKATILDNCLTELIFSEEKISSGKESEILQLLKQELASYFAGELKEFTVALKPEGTDFQQKIWELLLKIPIGDKISYKELSEKYGDPKAIRAVAAANGSNPIAILIPCHRVIGTDGNLRGYAWGLEIKRSLLELESKHSTAWHLFS